MSDSKKQIQDLTAQIAAAHDRRAAVEQQLERIEEVAAHGDAFSGELESLRGKRRAAAAQALIEERDADLREFDSAIAKLEKTSAAARSAADAAPVAIAQLNDQLAEIDDELADLVSAQRTTTRVWLDERYLSAEAQAAEAIRALGAALCKCAALEGLRSEVFPADFAYANATRVLKSLRATGALCAPLAASWCAKPENLGGAAVNRDEWHAAEWIAARRPGELQPEIALEVEIADELRVLGVDPDWRPTRISPSPCAESIGVHPFSASGVSITTFSHSDEYRRDPVGRASSGVTISEAR